MPLKIKELPEAERPYEKLKMNGEGALTNAELLSIIIKLTSTLLGYSFLLFTPSFSIVLPVFSE